MAFSKAVKTDALILAARHCCLCHRYRGVKVEIHHIVPQSSGGDDTLENAIALCFDCHADAGHYNAGHPRGTKISPEELRRAREAWRKNVENNEVEVQEIDDWLYCRYLVCKSFSALSEIVSGNLSRLPVENPMLAKTPAGLYMARLIRNYPENRRHSSIWGPSHENRDAYKLAYPDIQLDERSDGSCYPYFEASRLPSETEFREQISIADSISALLFDADVSRNEIAEVLAYHEHCGSDHFQEIYRIRPIWGTFLAATNICDQPIRVDSFSCIGQSPAGLGYREFTQILDGDTEELSLPKMKLMPGDTILVPLATVLGPLPESRMKCIRSEFEDIETGEVQQLDHASGTHLLSGLSVIGPSFAPVSIAADCSGQGFRQDLHRFDLGNLYVVDRFWEIGCCPHVFLEKEDGSVQYLGEIWSQEPNVVQHETFVVPDGVTNLVLAELEKETTQILRITCESRLMAENVLLEQGECLRIAVTAGDCLELVGSYVPSRRSVFQNKDPWRKNSIVGAFMTSQLSSGDEI